jgi:hypothetical protein
MFAWVPEVIIIPVALRTTIAAKWNALQIGLHVHYSPIVGWLFTFDRDCPCSMFFIILVKSYSLHDRKS